MQRLLKNLIAIAVIGLITMSASMSMARGGGHGGGHSGGGHSGGHFGGSHSSGHSRGSMSRGHSTSRTSNNHNSKMGKGTNKAAGKNKGGHNKSASHKGGKGKGKDKGKHRRRNHHRRSRYHMHYPSGSWLDGDMDADDADADVADGGLDVEFTSIRQLDAGDPAKNLAPAYRVWFHNNSTVDIDQPFDVAILASADGQLAPNLPYANVRIDGMAADETTSVDIRLPVTAMSMASDDQAAEFGYVHTIIDSQRELVETNKANNLSVYGREDIPALEE